MDYNAMKKQAEDAYENHKHNEAAALYNEIAENTGELYCIIRTIDINMSLAEASFSMAEVFGIRSVESALKHAKVAYKWLQICMKDENVMEELGEPLKKLYRRCLFIIGKALFIKEDSQCMDFLREAIDIGYNPARIYLGLWCHKFIENELEKERPDADFINDVAREAITQFETYIYHYNPDEAESDELKLAHLNLAIYYEYGLGTEANKVYAAKHRQLAELNE